MSILPQELQSIFKRVEENAKPLSDVDVSAEINTYVDQQRKAGKPVTMEMQAEAMAFDFCEDYEDEKTGWGYTEWPSIEAVTAGTLRYWEQRALETKHPALAARYADLVWDLSLRANGKRADVACARGAIDNYSNAIASGRYKHRNEAITFAGRALMLAVALNDKSRIEEVCNAILALDAAEAPEDDSAGIAFELLARNNKVLLSDETLSKILEGQEKSLARAVECAERDGEFPFSVDRTAEGLAAYYHSCQKYDDVRRVGGLWARAKISMAKRAGPMVGAAWLREVYAKLNDFGCSNEAEIVSLALRDLGKKSMDQMVEHTETIEIPRNEVDDWTNEMLSGELADVVRRVVVCFIPDPDKIQKQIKELEKTAPLMSFLSISQVDAEGRQVAEVGAVKDDLEGRVVYHMAQNLQFEAAFLRHLIKELVARHKVTSDMLIAEISKSPLIENGRRATWTRAFEASLAGDHVAAVHLFLPQIEHAVRLLAVGTGGSAYKPNRRYGGIQLKTLGDLLIDKGVLRVLGNKATTYLKVVLTDPRGWNLRNDLLHGITNPDQLGPWATDRLLHVALLLGSVRANPVEPNKST